jgi:hypothetical protein
MKLAGIVPLFLSALGGAAASCDVDLFKTVGVTAPSADAIDIVKQDTSSVTFNVSNKWASLDTDMLDFVFVQYNDAIHGMPKCVALADVAESWISSEFEAGCMTNKPISVVTIHVADSVLPSGNVGSLPTCCGGYSAILDAASAIESQSVSYTYVLECAPVACTPVECNMFEINETVEDPLADPNVSQRDIDHNTKNKHTPNVQIPVDEVDPPMTCECADKSYGKADGDGFVTGGGWIYLDPDFTYVDTDIVGLNFANQTKANFGFNAKSKNGVPDGSTNFVIDGKAFHFHSATGGQTNYDFLEVPDGIHARWWGTGHLSTGSGIAQDGDVYSFLVAVQDWGEPGADDTWRIRIWETGSSPEIVVFDTNPNLPLMDEIEGDKRFWGTELGELDANGGGNIQIHKSKMGRQVMLLSDARCQCDPEGKINPTDAGGGAFVTGGGWIYLADAIRNTTGTSEELNGNKANFGFNAKF